MNRNIFKITICSALILASCAKDEQAEGIHSQEQDLHTVTVNFNMPDGKPGFGEISDTKSSADSLFTAEVIPATRAVTGGWGNGDVMLMEISAGSTQARLTLVYTAPLQPMSEGGSETSYYWTLKKGQSYVKYSGDAFDLYSDANVPLFAEDTAEGDFQIYLTDELTMNMDWNSEETTPTVTCIYAPQMKWSLADEGTVTLASDAATQEKWTAGDSDWTTEQARLRVNTGTGNAGDVVTLTSSVFTTALGNKPADNIYTAVTDEAGNAYFYGTTESNDALTDNFTVELTKMSVPVPEDSGMEPCSVTRSIELDEDEENLIITPGTSLVLFKATKYNPIKLVSGKAYKILAEAKRDTEVNNNLCVIDGSCVYLDLITAQIEAALAADITEFTVINGLVGYNSGTAKTVVGEAIRTCGAADGKISLVLDDAITALPSSAFYGCTALKSVTTKATTIQYDAFRNCTGLTKVTLRAEGTAEIGQSAFSGCNNLATVVNLDKVTSIVFSAFASTALDGNVTINATSIGDSAFYGCAALTGVTVTEATSLGSSVFEGCSALQTVTLNKVTTIGQQTFDGCTSLTEINLPKATSIGNSAFRSCTSLTEINLPKATSIGNSAFNDCTGLTNVTFGAVLTNVDNEAFNGLTTNNCYLTLAAGQTDISFMGGNLKWAGKSWKSITVGDKVYTQENGFIKLISGGKASGVIDGAGTDPDIINNQIVAAVNAGIAEFTVINQLTKYSGEVGSVVGMAISQLVSGQITLTLEDATDVPDGAFLTCHALKQVSALMATKIGKDAFIDCTALTSVTTAATSIGTSAFYGCINLQSATFTSANTQIEAWTFSGCTKLTTVSWDKVTLIGSNAFNNCKALVNVSSNTVTTVGNSAFNMCELLKTVSLPVVTTLGNAVFGNCTSLTNLTLGKVTSVDLGEYTHSFTGATTTNCALTLHANQQAETSTLKVTAENGKLMWAGKQWKSITVGEIELKAVGNELYMLIADDGNLAYPEAWGGKIITAIGNYNLAGVYVTGNRLSIYYGNAAKRTVVGEAILSLGNYGESYNGRISLVLEAAEIPANAFSGCYALRSVVANSVTTIGIGAFYECTQITAITFGTVITEVGNYAFDQTPNQQVAPWTMSCDLTLGAGSVGDPDVNSKTWANCTWNKITLN